MEAGQSNAWIKFRADSYEAVVAVASVMEYPSSFLATLVQLELSQGSQDPAVRLNCDADKAREIVAVLRQGSRYKPPQDNPRLLSSLRHTLDFMGLPAPNFPCSSSHNEVLMVPGYVPSYYDDEGDSGLLMYSAATRGWAVVRDNDCRPGRVRWTANGDTPDRRWLAATLRSEYTSAGEDMVVMLPRGQREEPFRPVLLRASLKHSDLPAPPEHHNCTDAGLAAASGKLYLLGGSDADEPPCNLSDPSKLEVFDPHTGSWRRHPSNCSLPAAAMPQGTSLAAVAADEHTIMLLRAAPRVEAAAIEAGAAQHEAQQPPGRLDLPYLRMLRWLEGAALQRDYLHGVGLVNYDGKLLALGGCDKPWRARPAADAWGQVEYAPLMVTDAVSSYDLRNDSWCELPARLPVKLRYAAPVVVRTPGVQL